MNIDPKDKQVIDIVVDDESNRKSVRSWIVWIIVLVISLCALYLVNHDYVTGILGKTLAVSGILGVFLFIAFLSTKPFGRSNSSIFWRWFFDE